MKSHVHEYSTLYTYQKTVPTMYQQSWSYFWGVREGNVMRAKKGPPCAYVKGTL